MTPGKGSKYREFYDLSGRITCMGNDDIHKSLDEFEIRPDWTTNNRVSCPQVSEKLMFPFFLALYNGLR